MVSDPSSTGIEGKLCSAGDKSGLSALVTAETSVAVLRHLSSVPWLAKNVVWLVPDGQCGSALATTEVCFAASSTLSANAHVCTRLCCFQPYAV